MKAVADERRKIVVAALLALALFVFFARLGTPTWNIDEYYYATIGRRALHGNGSSLWVPPFGTYLIGLVSALTPFGSTGAARLVPALFGLGTGVVLFAFAEAVAGFWTGICAFAMWAFLPHPSVMGGAELAAIKIERFGLLDVFLTFFMAAALYAGWRWCTTERWFWAVLTGVLAGLAAAAKFPGVLALVPVAVVGLTGRGLRPTRVAQLAVAGLLCPLIFLLSFAASLSDAPNHIQSYIELGKLAKAGGHTVIVADRVYEFPPWWSNAWFMWSGMGALATIPLVALAVLAVVTIERRLAIYLALAVAGPFWFISFSYGLASPHYYLIWVPPLTLLAALGVRELVLRGRPYTVAGVLLCVPLTAAGVSMLRDVATIKPGDYRAASRVLDRAGMASSPLAVLGYDSVLKAYLPQAPISRRPSRATDAIVIDSLAIRRGGDLGPFRHWLEQRRTSVASTTVDRLRIFIARRR